MTKYIQKIGHDKANFYASVSTLIGVVGLFITILGYAWYDGQYKERTEMTLNTLVEDSKQNIAEHRLVRAEIDSIKEDIGDIKRSIKTLDIKKQDRSSIKPSDLNGLFMRSANLGPIINSDPVAIQ